MRDYPLMFFTLGLLGLALIFTALPWALAFLGNYIKHSGDGEKFTQGMYSTMQGDFLSRSYENDYSIKTDD